MEKINKTDWELHFTRFRCPLLVVVIQGAWARFRFPVESVIVNSSKVYLHKEQFKQCLDSFSTLIKDNPDYLHILPAEAYAEYVAKKDEIRALESINFKEYTLEQLISVFQKWFNWIYDWNTNYIPPTALIEDFLTVSLQGELTKYIDPITDFENFQKVQLLFSTSARPGFLETYEHELRDLLNKPQAVIEAETKRLANEYGWLGDPGRLENFWDATEVNKQLQNLVSKTEENIEEIIEKKLQLINATEDLRNSVSLIREWVYFRTFRMDVNQIFCFRIQFLLKEIARRLYVPLNQLTYLSANEIIDALNGHNLPSDLAERKKDFAIQLVGDSVKIVSGENAKELTTLFKEEFGEEIKELRGTTACTGKMVGPVKLVFTNADIAKVGEGDILVSPMTKPEFVVAMKRASAIITDEGGVTCHAAIVSRELNKPCVIGTKIATQIFKDGDLVEVDADKGVVRKIS